jgi:hypothetical protein
MTIEAAQIHHLIRDANTHQRSVSIACTLHYLGGKRTPPDQVHYLAGDYCRCSSVWDL